MIKEFEENLLKAIFYSDKKRRSKNGMDIKNCVIFISI